MIFSIFKSIGDQGNKVGDVFKLREYNPCKCIGNKNSVEQGETIRFMANLTKTVHELRGERDRLAKELGRLDEAISVLSGLGKRGRRRGGKRRLSPAARKRIADAQKARWAKWKARHQKRAA